MTDKTILSLFIKSVAQGPVGKGSTAYVYRLDDPELGGYLLKVRNEFLLSSSQLNVALLSEETHLYGVDAGFKNTNVGQIMMTDENRRIFTLLEQSGESLEQRFENYCVAKKGDSYQAALALLADLDALSEAGIRDLFDDVMQATRHQVGIDLLGEGNLFIDGDRLKLLDIPIMLDTYYEPECYNHVDGICSYIERVIHLETFSEEQKNILKQGIKKFRAKLNQIAGDVGFPETLDKVHDLVEKEKILFTGIREVTGATITLGDTPRILLEALKCVGVNNGVSRSL